MCVHEAAGMAALIVSGVCFCVSAWCWHGCTHSFLECVLCVCMEVLAWLHS